MALRSELKILITLQLGLFFIARFYLDPELKKV